MWLIYTWKSLEEKSHVLFSLANHPASHGKYILCGSYTHEKFQRRKVMSYPLQQTIQLHMENIYYVAHIHMEKSRGEKSCLILSSKPSSFTWRIYIMWLIYTWKSLEEKSHVFLSSKPSSFARRILCGSYTHGKVLREKVLSYSLLHTIQLHKGNIMCFIYTWKSLEGKSPVLSSLAIHPASQG